MSKKALMLASVASMIDQFNMSNIELLQSLGYRVDVVADFTNPGNISVERSKDLIKRLEGSDVRVVDIAVPRTLNPVSVLSAYTKVRKLISMEHYDVIHCHSPIGGVIARLAAKDERKHGTKVIYTAHGFHFFTGAPIKNWIAFYPVEKWLSKYTDVLITITKEDYDRAVKKLRAKRTEYVPGIGVDSGKFRDVTVDRKAKRSELGLKDDDIMILSVGELNKNKNHKVVVEALGLMNADKRQRYHYFIAGKDAGQSKSLTRLAGEKGVNLRLLGLRTDVGELLKVTDVFIMPSLREGLNVGVMEAMASGLPVLCGRRRGNTDLVDDKGGILFSPVDPQSVNDAIKKLLTADRTGMGNYNMEKIKGFDKRRVKDDMRAIYSQWGKD